MVQNAREEGYGRYNKEPYNVRAVKFRIGGLGYIIRNYNKDPHPPPKTKKQKETRIIMALY